MRITKRSEEFVDFLKGALRPGMRALVALHDNPDPDCIAAGLCMSKILTAAYGVPCVIAYGGILGRAENRQMAASCGIPLVRAGTIKKEEFDFIVTVDSQPGAGNTFVDGRRTVNAVIDHHRRLPTTRAIPWVDIRLKYGATGTITLEYVLAHKLDLTAKEATALFYALKSETQDLGRESGAADRRAYFFLFSQVDFKLLYEIVYAELSRDYFRALHHGLQHARIYNDALVTSLDEIDTPDSVAEAADRLLRLKGIKWTFVTGRHNDRAYFSIRTSYRDANAGELIQQVAADLGKGGGHEMIAGGRVDLTKIKLDYPQLAEELAARFLRALRKRSAGAELLEPEK
ncbi:MAG: phosphoesterase [Myxococcales bacterium]|nr:MAG: phosphoesterase [Myxococcales bacterium]